MKETKKYWKGLEELNKTPEFEKYANKEFPEKLPLEGEGDATRRDFLKMMGFGVAAVSLAACETPIRKAIPYVKKPVDVDPSVPNYYASTFVSGSDAASMVVKTREGRPIKIEGNKLASTTGGGTSTQMEASVLSLYDKARYTGPKASGKGVSWEDLDKSIKSGLAAASGSVYLVSNSISSPSTNKAIEVLAAKVPGLKTVAYDPISVSGALDANEKAFGKRALPSYDYSKAEVIASFGADFLGTSSDKVISSRQFAETRKLYGEKNTMSRLYAFESNLSLTGANADYRIPIKPSQEGLYVGNLYNKLASKAGASTIIVGAVSDDTLLNKCADDLWKSKGASIVVSGSNDANVQLIVIGINALLSSYGTTIDINTHQNTRKGNDQEFGQFVDDLAGGSVGGVIFYNCNPVYDHPRGSEISAGIGSVGVSVSTADRPDETSSLVGYNAPDHHFLESWNDFEITKGNFSLSQPTISNIFDTRQAQDSFLSWSDDSSNYYDFLRSNWETEMFPLMEAGKFHDFNQFWDTCLHDGVLEFPMEANEQTADFSGLGEAASAVNARYSDAGSGLELVIYQNNSVGDGVQANNPWLHEMPDPITKVVWDNYLTVSARQAEEWGIEIGDMSTQLVELSANGTTVKVPVMVQPGQAYNTVGLAVGYGRTVSGKVAMELGVNAYPFTKGASGVSYTITEGVSVNPTSEGYRIAQTQTHHTFMGRDTVIQDATLAEYQKDTQAGRSFPKIATSEGFKKPYAVSLWQGHEYANHHWGLMVDLNSCTGCGTCTVACQVENNIPVVGKQEVLNRREMHWIRIDRYYSSDATEGKGMEDPSENPEVTFQPMMCQQCNNAPCETVCPVAATTHSTEGLNQMTYNRCIGTRYCANNCPYKVRRFNWFKYHDNTQFDTNLSMSNDLGKMVLNPDVTVRSRGVMEKCSFCVQRIQLGKVEAKKEGRRPEDGEINSACAASCPSEALVFGDMKDPKSQISQLLKIKVGEKGVESQEDRAYHVLEEIRVMPNVWYLSKIRNKDREEKTADA